MLGHLLFPWVCGNKSWIKQPRPTWWGSTWDADYPEREQRRETPSAFNRRQGKTSRDPPGKRQERLPGAARDAAGMDTGTAGLSHSVPKGHGRCWAAGKDLLLTSTAKKWENAPEHGHELGKKHPSYLRAPG